MARANKWRAQKPQAQVLVALGLAGLQMGLGRLDGGHSLPRGGGRCGCCFLQRVFVCCDELSVGVELGQKIAKMAALRPNLAENCVIGEA